jgi:lipopolysaccharide/colanic/teichoic acid biosynthesis glycosyltransferase
MYPYIKRLFDFIFSLIALLLLAPILIPVVIGLLLTGEHHVFYLQKRLGYKNKYFNILKFATMLKNSPNMGTGSITMRNDPRLLPMGKFLRKTKINELPQIINVLIGSMSIVGPRPLVDRTFNAYPEDIRNKVYDSIPGITGVGSVFFRDEESLISNSGKPPHEFYAAVIAPYKGALEMWYNQHKSFYVDTMLIFLTVWVVVFPKSKLMFKIFKNLPTRNF